MTTQSKTLVTLTNAGLKRDGRWLVRGVSLSIKKGEILTLIGPNGSGKSTTTKMALGLLAPDEGRVQQAENLTVGYVPQRLFLDWSVPLTVQRMMRLTGGTSSNDADAALKRTGADHLKTAQMRTLSGGEFQRVLLARAIARKPDLLVLDEPAQGVDFNGELAFYDLISAIRDELGCGIMLVSHDLHLVMAATDQVLCLNGHVCCQGSPKAVTENPAYRDLFGARASSTLAVYEHHHDHTHLPDGRVQHEDGSITHHCHPEDGHHYDGGDHNHG